MSSFETLMNFGETSIPPKVICEALKDVVGVEFDPSNEDDRNLAAALVQKLDTEKVSDLTERLAQYLKTASLISSEAIIAPRPFRVLEAVPVDKEDLLSTDHPSDASETSEEDIGSAGITSFPRPEFEPVDNGWAVVIRPRTERRPIYSPLFLGFEDEESRVTWRPTMPDEWEKFLSAAEAKIQTRRLHSWRSFSHKLHHGRPKIFCAEQLAKNYGVVNLKDGSTTSVAHFLFLSDTLYFVVVLNEHVKRLTANVKDIDTFTQNIVDAFEGHEDYAKDTLVSLRKAFDTYSPDNEIGYSGINP